MNGIVPYARSSMFGNPFGLAPYRQDIPQNLNPPSPTAPQSVKDWWRELKEASKEPERPTAMQSAVVGLRHNGEGAAIGALLALIDTDLGGLDLGGRVPLDWAGAALFYALSIRDAGDPNGLASDFRAMGQSCTTIAMYRMVHKWREAAKGMPRNIATSGDPVLAAGQSSAF